MKIATPQQYADYQWSLIEKRLREFVPEIRIDLNSEQVRGALPERNLGPITLATFPFTGMLGRAHGGTGINTLNTGPGYLKQISANASFTVALPTFGEIDFSLASGSFGSVLHLNAGVGAFQAIDLTGALTALSGALTAPHGGTGQSSYTTGDLLYASSGTTLAKLADVATGNALISGGVGAAPSWGKIALTTHVSGVLAGTNGGTGVNNGSFLLTVPATGTAALLGTAQTFSADKIFSATLDGRAMTRIAMISGTTGYGLRFWDATNDFGAFQCQDNGAATAFFFSANRQLDGTSWQQLNSRIGDSLILGGGLSYFAFAAASSVPVLAWSVVQSGLITHVFNDAGTNTAPNTLLMRHNSSGTPVAGFGVTHEQQLDSATVNNRIAATEVTTWATATDATRKARRVRNIYDTAAREAIREEASGTAAMIGFLGAAAVVRQNITGVTTGTLAQLQAATRNLLTGLANLGLITDSTT
jgi:hypothetical protein